MIKTRRSSKGIDKLKIVLSEKLEEAERLKQCLDSYQTAFNFVGLSKGIRNLLIKEALRNGRLVFYQLWE